MGLVGTVGMSRHVQHSKEFQADDLSITHTMRLRV